MADQALIPVFTGELIEQTTQYCNARDLHASLQVGRDFSNWIKDRIEQYGFVEGEDYSPNLANRSDGKPGKRRLDYHLTLDMAKELAMIENNEIGRQVRRYFIQAEKELRQRIIADLEEKARHVLSLPGVKPLRDGLSTKGAFKLQEQSQKVLRMILKETSKVERQNLHFHYHQINLTLGMPSIDLDTIEAELSHGQPEKGA